MQGIYLRDFSGRLIDCDEGLLEWVKKDRLSSLPQLRGQDISTA
jgi:hypothetical protein